MVGCHLSSTTALTQPLCPSTVCRCAPVAASQSRHRISTGSTVSLTVAILFSSGLRTYLLRTVFRVRSVCIYIYICEPSKSRIDVGVSPRYWPIGGLRWVDTDIIEGLGKGSHSVLLCIIFTHTCEGRTVLKCRLRA